MKINDCVKEQKESMIAWDTKKIAEAIKSRDPEFLLDLYLRNSVLSGIDNFIIARLIKELLGYDPYDST